MLCGVATPVWSASGRVGLPLPPDVPPGNSSPGAATQALRDFDIPAQPLGDALSQYGIASDQPAIFMSDMLNGRMSSAVRGRYLPEAALRLLLEGSGLAIEKISSALGDSFLLKEAGAAPAASPTLVRFFSTGNYPGLIQKRILAALCANTRTTPGSYRALFRFQLDAAGRVQDASLLNSTDDRLRDEALLEVLRNVQIDVPPPPTVMRQALTMRLKRGDSQTASACHRQGAS